MTSLRKLAGLPPRDARLLVEAATLIVTIRLAVSLLPFRAVRRVAARAARRSSGAAPGMAVERIVWAVRAVASRAPGSTCLVQALAGHALLARHGHPARLRLGVRRDGALRAHAWVENDGGILIGDTGGENFVPFPLASL